MIAQFSNIPVSLDAMAASILGMRDGITCEGDYPQIKRSTPVFEAVVQACGLKDSDIASMHLLRRSVDARKRADIHFVITVTVDAPDLTEGSLDALCLRRGVSAKPYVSPEPLSIPDLSSSAQAPGYMRPVVVGTGPAGLFCALCLARAGLKPIVVERGQAVEDRLLKVAAFADGGALDPDSNIQFGEGGAGTFSDGKLNTGTKSPHIRHVLDEFVKAGAPKDILVDAKPHIGTDILPEVVANIRREILQFGGEVRFSTRLAGIEVCDTGIVCTMESPSRGDTRETYTLEASSLILAIGHSARDTYEMLLQSGMPMERKPFAVGVRIEHLQADMDKAQYGKAAGHPALGAADYKLAVHNADGRGVYTFCMCPGGTVVAASSEEGRLCVNGMSVHARDGRNSNSALLVSVNPDDIEGDDVMGGVLLQREMESAAYGLGCSSGSAPYTAPAQTVGDFMDGRYGNPSRKVSPTYPRGVAWCDLRSCLPAFVSEALEEALPSLDVKLHGFANPEAVLTGVEPRSSSPVRILRDKETLEVSGFPGIYPAGEGAGYAGGIMSAAVDGIRVAEAVFKKYM